MADGCFLIDPLTLRVKFNTTWSGTDMGAMTWPNYHQHTVVEGGEVGGQVQEAILEHHMQERQEGQATGLALYVAHRVGWQGVAVLQEQGFPRGAGVLSTVGCV